MEHLRRALFGNEVSSSTRIHLIRNNQFQYVACTRRDHEKKDTQHMVLGFSCDRQRHRIMKMMGKDPSLKFKVVGTCRIKVSWSNSRYDVNRMLFESDMEAHEFYALPYTHNLGIAVLREEPNWTNPSCTSYVSSLIVPSSSKSSLFRM